MVLGKRRSGVWCGVWSLVGILYAVLVGVV